jgi:hypothetical protein
VPLILLAVKRIPDGDSELFTHSVCREKNLEWRHFSTHCFSRETKLEQSTSEARAETQEMLRGILKRSYKHIFLSEMRSFVGNWN